MWIEMIAVGVEFVAIRRWLGRRKRAVTIGPLAVEVLFGTI